MMLSTDFVRKLVEFMERAPYYVRKLVIFIEQHPEAGITKGKQSLEPGGNLLATLEAYLRAVSSIVDYKSEKTRSKALGTGGSIYRVEAIEQVGGFDQNIRGYGEDWDVEMQSEQQVGHCVRLTLNFLITRDIN
jgi:GT2 family glycosyltransferase